MNIRAQRIYGLDFLKVMATIAIVLHHYQQVFDVWFEKGINFYGTWFEWGFLVELFFLLSGYFMYRYSARIYGGEIELGSWVYKRAKRLLPMMAVSAVVYEIFLFAYWILTGSFFASLGKLSGWGVIITALGLQSGGVFSNPGINNPTWYISVLMICYTVFYLVTRLAAILKCRPCYLYVAMVIFGLGILNAGISLPFMNNAAARGYRSFFYGLLLAQFVDCCGITRKEVCSCTVISAMILGAFAVKPGILSDGLDNVLCYGLYPCIILLLESAPIRKLFHPFWGTLGQISFHVYIWHLTVCLAVATLSIIANIQLNYNSVGMLCVVVAMIIVAGCLSYGFLEKPLDRFVENQASQLRDRAEKKGNM